MGIGQLELGNTSISPVTLKFIQVLVHILCCHWWRVSMESAASPLELSHLVLNKSISEAHLVFMDPHTISSTAKYNVRFSLFFFKTFNFEIDFESDNIVQIKDHPCLYAAAATVLVVLSNPFGIEPVQQMKAQMVKEANRGINGEFLQVLSY